MIALCHSQKMGLPYSGSQRLATIPCMGGGGMLTTVKEGCTHVCNVVVLGSVGLAHAGLP